jgi:Uma2 family endonuclease
MTTSTQDRTPGVFAPFRAFVVRLPSDLSLSDEQLLQLSRLNPDLRIERNAHGDILVMAPTGGETGERNAEITMQLRMWAKKDRTGATFDSSTGFRLESGAVRCPDAAWIRHSRLSQLTKEQRKGLIPLCPDFLIELVSPSDSMSELRSKMEEYIDNGAQLGWLLDPESRRAFVYRPDKPVEELDNPARLAADPLMKGFGLDLTDVW